MPSPSAPLRRAIVSASSAGGSRRAQFRLVPRAGGRDGEAGCARRAGAARVRGRRRRPGSVHRLRRALGEVEITRARMDAALEAFERAFAHARQAGYVPPRVVRAARLLSLRRHDPGVGAARVARRERAPSRAGPLPPCLPGRGARDARSLRRGARDPRRSACGAGRARRRESCSRTSPRSSPSGSSSWPAIPPPQPSSERKGAGCTRSWGNRVSCRPRPGASRRRSTRSTGSRRQTPGPAARRSSARATTPIRRCSGGRSGRRCSRAVASTPRRSGSPARRWRSAMTPTCSTRRATRTPTSPRCSCSPASATRRSPRSRQALERYERKGNLVSAQRARARLAELRDA